MRQISQRVGARRWAALLAGGALAAGIIPGAVASASASTSTASPKVTVIVQKSAHAGRTPERAVAALGGRVTTKLPFIHSFVARIPARGMNWLGTVHGVAAVSPDRSMHVQAVPATVPSGNNLPSVYRKVVGADRLANAGANGHGVTVALIDTGVAPLPDLAGRIVDVDQDPLGVTEAPCVNFSGEAGCDDNYGHGTFIAGLIAGNGTQDSRFVGAAPNAKILSLKLAGADGSADVSKVLAALQWVVSFRGQYNIKVVNLSLGTDSTQSYRVDPLNYAVEQAWKAGITVVVAASNRGPGAATISKPADDPFVITVGASDDNGTQTLNDDAIPNFSSHGPTAADGLAKPDVLAPGTHLVSLGVDGSTINTLFPSSMTAPYRRGSGTSFANGVVAGVVADMLSANPLMSPNRVKYVLMTTARSYAGADPMAQGEGVIDGYAALNYAFPGLANQGVDYSDGSGSLELSRGTVHVDALGVDGSVSTVSGDLTAELSVYNPLSFLQTAWNSLTWWNSQWVGSNWSGSNWSGSNWSGSNWSGSNWSGSNWSGSNWSGSNWSGSNWSGSNWSGSNWSGSTWYGSNWSGSNWSNSSWYSGYWYGAWDA